MATAHKAFCCAIVRSHFGPVVEAVASVLITRGRLRLAQLISSLKTPLPHVQVKKALIVLMQHGIVKATTTEERRRAAPALPSSAAAAAAQPESARLVSVYEIDCARIYLRIRYPKYVLLMKEAYGDEAEVMSARLAEHGKLASDQLTNTVVDHFTNGGIERMDEASQILEVAEKALHAMITDGFLMKEEFLVVPDGGTCEVDEAEQEAPEEVAMTPAARRLAAKREAADEASSKRRKVATGAAVAASPAAEGEDRVILWAFNHARFQAAMVRALVVHYVESRCGVQGGSIVMLMLDSQIAGGSNNSQRGFLKQPAMSIGKIMTLLPGAPRVAGLTATALAHLLLELHHERVPILLQRAMQAGPAGYAVNTAGILEDLRLLHVKQIVGAKFGHEAARIFQIVLDGKMLEEKPIQEMALVPKKTAKELLHRMLVEKFLYLQEVPKTLSDRTPARTTYLWSVPVDAVHGSLLHSFYTSWEHLKARADAENQQLQSITEKDKFKTAEDLVLEEKLTARLVALEGAMLLLDDSLALFRDMK